MLDVWRLRLLRELAALGTLANVAETMHVSPSSVSQQLSQLEREAGVPLLQKVGRRVQLTPAAEILVEHAGVILDRLERAEADVAGLRDQASGTLRIAAFQSAAVAFMPRLLAELADEHPRLRVTMSQRLPETALRETVGRQFDLVIAEQYPHQTTPLHPDLDSVALTADPLRLAVPLDDPSWSGVRSIADAAALPWVVEPDGAASRRWTEQVCREAGFEPDIRFETDDLQAHIALIESGHAQAVLPGLMLVRGTPAIRAIDLPGKPRRSVFTAARSSTAQAPAIVACRETLASIVPATIP